MFTDNKYTTCYYRIISNARNRITEGYTEQHHIVPVSMGGSNDASNLAKLTAKEHFVCHRLLTKMVSESQHRLKMFNAIWLMQASSKNQQRYKINSHTYSIIKRDIALAYTSNPNHRSIESREKQSKTITGRVHGPMSDETKEKLRQSHLGKKLGPSKLRGRTLSISVKDKISESLKGKSTHSQSAETKRKISESKTGVAVWSDEQKRQMSDMRKGIPKSPEHRAKLAAAARARWIRSAT